MITPQDQIKQLREVIDEQNKIIGFMRKEIESLRRAAQAVYTHEDRKRKANAIGDANYFEIMRHRMEHKNVG